MVDEKVIFFNSFLKSLEHDPGNLSFVEPEGSVVGPADQVIGVDVLNDSQWTAHAGIGAKSLPTFPELL